ncbi:MAG: GGDEF domain-containing protein [Eubacterium sp.]|nr:GGDEF domain-containing protein [Eubacterium sp.]
MKLDTTMFDNIIDAAQDCIFWKDKNRRFVGANQAFLDFYGFKSTDVLIGKTDEDMGWHSDPVPFMRDELRVLEGHATYKVQGKCFVDGEERDIIATKRPIYKGGEIVGLVGSFADVTEVMRRNKELKNSQVMYSIAQLREIPYFDSLIDEVGLDQILDPLTGIISRAYIFDFAKSLIASRTQFTFAIIDLDNFKDINDTYGHQTGDVVLMEVSKALAESIRGFGIAGRFGGDELLLVNLRDITPVQKEEFFKDLYEGHKALRRNIISEGRSIFVTGTSGCATYPDDAANYDDLFLAIDKTLYKGKTAGRNCYTVYNEAEHKDLEVRSMAKKGVFSCMRDLENRVNTAKTLSEALECAMPVLEKELMLSEIYFTDADGRISDFEKCYGSADGIEQIVKDGLYADSSLDRIRSEAPVLYESLYELDIKAVLIAEIAASGTQKRYIICPDKQNQRLWQEDECGVIYFLSKILEVTANA